MSIKPTFLNDELYQYLLTISVRSNPILEQGNRFTNEQFGIPMQSSPEQLNFLNWWVSTTQPECILEIGTYTGLSALAMAQALSKDGKIICLDHDKKFTRLAQQLWQQASVSEKIELRLGEARILLDEISRQRKVFDLVFIDADKGNYKHYYEMVLPLLHKKGVIIVDNVLWHGRVLEQNNNEKTTIAIRQFNRHLFADKRVKITVLPIGDGLLLATKL